MERITLTVKEAADYIGVSKDLIYKLVRENDIPNVRVANRILFRKIAIDKWMQEKEQRSFSHEI